MNSKSNLTLLATIVILHAVAAQAASIDMENPRRAVGREGDIRIDAQLVRDTVSPGTPIGVTYQIRNFSKESVAIASRVADATYDTDSRTVMFSIGSEVPPAGAVPQMVVIAPGETKVFRAGAIPTLSAAASRGTLGAPRYVQVKVAIMRDVRPFLPLIEAQKRVPQRLTDAQFETWFECNDTILLNTLPVQFAPARAMGASADARSF